MTNNRYNTNSLRIPTSKNIHRYSYSFIFICFLLLFIVNFSNEMSFKIKRNINMKNNNGEFKAELVNKRSIQRRWVPLIEELKEVNEQYPFLGPIDTSKREVSESELNSLLKNAWLGR
ncbi:unnamed protein product [Meloidogyne enterolobii]|uniref:Uncharacterized protein n=1 Tax=Meloidogyne enterolobii TaxID=390850 RepID=A0ACB0ZYK2_MELEN